MLALTYCGRASFLAILAATLLASSGARADELLVMPYSCKVIRGQPTLVPSDDQGHVVIGRREQRAFRACSPENPNLCRRWTVHRFDMDCGGVRVPWVDVAAAAVRDGRAYVERGRFKLEMPPQWSLPPDVPCARRGDYDGWEFGRLEGFCAERLARIPRVTVAMPRGFAPMLGIDGIFVEDTRSRGAMAEASPAPSRHDFAPEPPAVDSSRGPQTPDAIPHPVKRKAAQKAPERSEAPPVRASVPQQPKDASPSKTSPSSTSSPALSEPPRTEHADASERATGSGAIVPTIINAANAPDKPSASQVNETGALPKQAAAVAPDGDEEGTEQSHVAGSGSTRPDLVVSAEGDDAAPLFPVAAVGGLPFKVDVTVMTLASLALIALLTLAIALRRGRTATVSALSRDLSSVSFGGNAAQAGEGKGALTPVAEACGRDVSEPPALPAGPPAPLGDAMPRTRADALHILGMGIASDVNEVAVKKIIDGLRLSWHPDHARDPEDRAKRELRLKQINAAWDILSGERKG